MTPHQHNKIGDTLTREQIEELQRLGALEWGPRDIAVYLGVEIAPFTAE